MKKLLAILINLPLAAALLFFTAASALQAQEKQEDLLLDRISSIGGVTGVERLKSTHFKDKYVLMFEQPLDHKRPEKGTFRQRVFVMNAGLDRPTVIVTEGYGAATHQGHSIEMRSPGSWTQT